jgi:hypothetical protein
LGQAGTLFLDPVLELRGSAQKESVEERPAVFRDSALELSRLEPRREGLEIGREHVGIEAKVRRPEEQLRRAEIAPQAVEQLGETVVGPIGGGLGPEHGEHPVAAEPPPPDGRKQP